MLAPKLTSRKDRGAGILTRLPLRLFNELNNLIGEFHETFKYPIQMIAGVKIHAHEVTETLDHGHLVAKIMAELAGFQRAGHLSRRCEQGHFIFQDRRRVHDEFDILGAEDVAGRDEKGAETSHFRGELAQLQESGGSIHGLLEGVRGGASSFIMEIISYCLALRICFLECLASAPIRMFIRTEFAVSQHPLPPPTLRRPIQGIGTILTVHDRRLVTIRMSNGFETLAHWPPSNPEPLPELAPGMKLELEFSPYNMSQVCILSHGH